MSLQVDPSTLSPSGHYKADAFSGADGSLVGTWADSSGNGRDLTQATTNLKPRLRLWQLNDLPSVRFDGSDDFLQSAANLSAFLGTDGLGTIIAVTRFDRVATPGAAGYGILGVNAALGTKLSMRYDYTPWAFEAQNNDGTPDAATIPAPEDTTFYGSGPYAFGANAPAPRIVVWRHDTGAAEIQVGLDNLDDAAFVSTASGASSDLANALLLGRSFEHYWDGDIFEVILFPTALTEAQLRGVCLWLTDKYALPYESGIAAEAGEDVTMAVEMKLPTSELTFSPTLHLKADAITGLNDSDPVETWPDSSGNGNDASQSTAGFRPLYKTSVINGQPALLFDGSDDYMTLSALLSALLAGGGAGTVYVVARADITVGEQDQTLFADTGGNVHLTVIETGADVLRASNDDGVQDTVTKAYIMGNWMIGLWMHHPDERTVESPSHLYVGVDETASADLSFVASGDTTAAILANAIEIGRGSGYVSGYIAEILFFGRAHSAVERRHVRSYLAEKYGFTYPESEYEPVWLDVTEDVRNSRGLSFGSGMEGADTKDRVASAGELRLVLENDATQNSAGLEGYYSPEHTNVRSGFRVGTPVRVSFLYYGTRYYKWRGWITNLRVIPGQNLERAVAVTAGDWLDYAARMTLSNLPIRTDERADQLMWRLYANSPREPESIFFNKGSDVYAYAFDFTEDEGILILAELYRLTISEFGHTYMRGDTVGGGQLRFAARGVWAAADVIRWTLADAQIEALEPSDHGLDGIINRVIITLHPRRADTGATTVIYKHPSSIFVASSGSVTFVCPYRDPANPGERIGGTNVVTPVANMDYTAHQNSDGTGADYTANFLPTAITKGGNATTITFTNSGPDGYLDAGFQIRGDGLYAFEPTLVDLKDSASIAKYGQNTRPIDMAYQADINLANAVATQVLANNKDPRTKVPRVGFTANYGSTHMMHALAREIGDRVAITEQVSGLSAAEYFINGIRFEVFADTKIRASWLLAPAEQEDYS